MKQKLEETAKGFDVCPLLNKCNPNKKESKEYCVINYQNCSKYIQYEAGCYNQEMDLWDTTRMLTLDENKEWKKWLRKVRKRW
jgi:hypothetical protein